MNKLKKIILGSVLLSCSQYVFSAATCSANSFTARDFVTTLAPANITVGPDMPNGTVIYRLDFKDPGTSASSFTCGAGAFSVPQNLEYNSTPMPLASWNGTPFPNRVYQTSVPGIGVAISSDLSNQAIPTTAFTTTYSGTGYYSFSIRINAVLSLIKIGAVSPGTITGGSLPTVRLNLGPDPSVSNSVIRIYNLSYAGSLNIVSQTCTTPDVNVPLGSYETSIFNAVGTATPWMDASIVLNNCPRFYGYYNNTSFNTSPGSGATTVNTAVANVLNVNLTPQNSIWDTARGIMNVTSSTGSATGVGIQLAWGDKSASPQPMNWNQTYSYTPGNSTATTFKIPLSARYYQTSNAVTPGRADGKVTFTINYY
ncbi:MULTISPECIES: fimbrial protein [unclassified Serratia (in: enterobacteria)]|uniref:fimbrial protein n=1 Tax=unclassified Serratia (in: enterobacteria) TaxID=2647522 RepID=UPI003075F49F